MLFIYGVVPGSSAWQRYPPVRQAYGLAVASHRYESVPYIRGGKLRAYALNHAAEYFRRTVGGLVGVKQ